MTVDLTQFHAAFFEESFEALDVMEAALLKLDVGSPEPELINTIFRVAHSIKGGSATFGFAEIASFTHSLETLLDELRGGRMAVTVPVSDLLLKSVDVMRAMLRAVQAKQPIDAQRVSDLQFDLEVAIMKKDEQSPVAPAAAAGVARPPTSHEPQSPRWRIRFHPYRELLARGNDPLRMLRELATLGELAVRVDAQTLPPLADVNPQDCYLAWSLELPGEVSEEAIRQVFEWAEGDCDLTIERLPRETEALLPAPATSIPAPAPGAAQQTAAAAAAAPASIPARTDAPAKQETPVSGLGDSGSIRVSVEKIDELMNTVGELVITQAMLSQLGSHFDGADAEKLRGGLAQLERNMRELQESVMRVRMLPISFVFSRFPRMVRDLAQRLGKQIELKLTGEQTELDKTVLEKIGDPLMHLVRNCIDHGIESPETRVAAGKSAEGTVHLDAYHSGGNIAVEVSDDGGGLDRERILAKAHDRGLLDPNDSLTDAEINELIFVPGFSTAEKTTDVSGRGVGMDVVRRNVKQLGGKIDVRSDRGRGSRFTITLPLTLAIVDGQSVAVGTETYIVPLISIVESMQLKATGVTRLSGHREVLSFRGDYLPIIRLHDLFGVEPRSRALHEGLVVVAEGDGRRVGLFVDDLLGQQQVVIKSLETNYGHIEGVSGATILGDGSVALILDVPGLIRAASMRAAA
jgi:two-component system chemotaxis sensor kinase CheA